MPQMQCVEPTIGETELQRIADGLAHRVRAGCVKKFEEYKASYKSYRIFTNRVLNKVRLSASEVAHQLRG